MRQVYRIDSNGFYVEPVILMTDEGGADLPANCVEVAPPSFYKAKWDGTKWIEVGAAPEVEPRVTVGERLKEVETESITTMLAVTEAYEDQLAADANREDETVSTMMGLSEAYEMILTLQARIEALEGGGV